jgi:hypothetical protein
MNLSSKEITKARIEYLFSLYSATFVLTKADDYSSIIQLTQKGGLLAFYYESVNFEPLSLVADNDLHSHLPGFYTQVDKQIDFELGE